MSNNCICPDVDCQPVVACIDTELGRTAIGTGEFTNFCAAVTSCVDAQFEAISNGASNDYNFFPQAIVKILQSFTGFSNVGDSFLSSDGTSVSWVPSSAFGATYLANGTGITVSGTGASADPYKPNLNTTYVKALFSGANGLIYSDGLYILGGPLNQNTNIIGASHSLTIDNLSQGIITGTSLDFKGFNSVSNYGRLLLGGSQSFLQLLSGTRAYSLEFNDVSHLLTLGTTDDIIIQDGTQINPAILGTSKTYLKIVNYHHKNAGDMLTLTDILTGEVAWTTPPSAAAAYTDEKAQDAIGTILLPTVTIFPTYSDLTPSLSFDVINSSITFGKIQNISTDKILGRDTALTGAVEEIGVGGGIEFTGSGSVQVSAFTGDVTKPAGSTVTTLGSNSVTNTKLRDSSGFSVIGKPDTGSGDPSDIVAGVDSVLRRSGSGDLSFGTIVTNNIGTSEVTFAKLQNINTSRILGRSTVGTGDIEALTIGNGLNLAGGTLSTLGRTLIGVTSFLVSGTWTKPSGCNSVLVYTVGGGGGGGGATSASAQASVGSGGGGGGYSLHFITSGLGSSETVTVGNGGDGGSSINSYAGQNGSISSFGSFTGVNGGSGGVTVASGTAVYLGPGGATGLAIFHPSGQIYTSSGSAGGTSIRLSGTIAIGGIGGSSVIGGSEPTFASAGAGGSGAVALNGASADGDSGGSGIVIVYEYS